MDWNYLKNGNIILLFIITLPTFHIGLLFFIWYLKVIHKKTFFTLFSFIYTFFSFIIFHSTYPIILGNYYYESGFYADSMKHYKEVKKRLNSSNYSFIYRYLYSSLSENEVDRRVAISTYSAQKYDQAIPLLRRELEKARKSEQPYFMLYIANSFLKRGEKKEANRLAVKSYLMAISIFDEKELKNYEIFYNRFFNL
ncbi:hypothetical protein JXR93_06320 [bacterium]|nr:hypothetical protein [bacterium]